MPPIDPKAVAAARRRRTHRLRTRVAVLASSAFLALFAGITVQMAGGHDPVLNASTKSTTTTKTTTSAATPAATSSSSSSSGDSSSSQPASVTTSQS